MTDPTCPICGEWFSSQYEVDVHIQKYHPTPTEPTPTAEGATCPICGEWFSSQYEVDVHVQKYHAALTCPYCGATFTSQADLNAHIASEHPREEPPPGAFTWNGCKAVYCYGDQVNLDAVKAAGFNTLICYSYAHTILDEALSKGLWIIPYLGGGNVNYVNQWKHHPAIGAWYFLDEPEYRGHSIAQQQTWYNALKAADPNRDFLTIFSTHGGNHNGVNYYSRSTFDHCGIDVYPFNDECFRYGTGEWNGDWVGYLTYCLNRYNAFSGGIGGMAVSQAFYDLPEYLNPAGHIKALLQVFQGLGIGTQRDGYALYISEGGGITGIFQDSVLRAEVTAMNPTYNWPHAPPQPITEYVCPYCGATFTSQADLDAHIASEHHYVCPYCGATFTTQAELDAHITSEHPPAVYTCPHCGATFSTQADLDAHIASVHPTETFSTEDITCSRCSSTLRVTISSISANNVSQNCGVCGLSGIAEGTKIEIIHAEPWPPPVYTCPYCGLTFGTQAELDLHIASEHPVFTCPECGATFASQAELDSHIASEHPPIVYTCPECGATFSTEADLDAHIASTHPPPVYECPHCGLTFASEAELDAHIASEHPAAPVFKCVFCGAIFASQADLNAHIATEHPIAAEPVPWYKRWQTYLLLGGVGTLIIGGIAIKKRVAKR